MINNMKIIAIHVTTSEGVTGYVIHTSCCVPNPITNNPALAKNYLGKNHELNSKLVKFQYLFSLTFLIFANIYY